MSVREMAQVKAEEQNKRLTFFYFNSENFALLLILNDLLLDNTAGMLKKASRYRANWMLCGWLVFLGGICVSFCKNICLVCRGKPAQ